MSTTTTEYVSIDQLNYDQRVQRKEGTSLHRAAAIAAKFNPDALGTITVSRREDGSMAILDGAHRVEACRIIKHELPLRATVHHGLTLAQEATLFDQLNTFKQPSATSRFLARVTGGDTNSMEVYYQITRNGWDIATGNKRGAFSAISAAEAVYYDGNGALPKGTYPELLDGVFRIAGQAWDLDPRGSVQNIVRGLGLILARYGNQVNEARLIEQLSLVPPRVLVARGRATKDLRGGTPAAGVAHAIVLQYNQGLRKNKLPEYHWTA